MEASIAKWRVSNDGRIDCGENPAFCVTTTSGRLFD
jgi:hypothetical protein